MCIFDLNVLAPVVYAKFFSVFLFYRLYFKNGKTCALIIRLKQTHIEFFLLRFAPFKPVNLFSKSHQWREKTRKKSHWNSLHEFSKAKFTSSTSRMLQPFLILPFCPLLVVPFLGLPVRTVHIYTDNQQQKQRQRQQQYHHSCRSKQFAIHISYCLSPHWNLVPLFNEFIWTGWIKNTDNRHL